MTTRIDRRHRRDRIVELIQAHAVKNQEDLRALLEEEDVVVNQATLSRDLRDLGVVKGPKGYQLPTEAAAPAVDADALWPVLRAYLTDAVPAQNLVVLHTPPGGAHPLAIALDASGMDELLGTIAGDDTVLCISPDSVKARSMARRLLRQRGVEA